MTRFIVFLVPIGKPTDGIISSEYAHAYFYGAIPLPGEHPQADTWILTNAKYSDKVVYRPIGSFNDWKQARQTVPTLSEGKVH